jgi:hypothetical protein
LLFEKILKLQEPISGYRLNGCGDGCTAELEHPDKNGRKLK